MSLDCRLLRKKGEDRIYYYCRNSGVTPTEISLWTDFGDRSATYQSAEAMWAVLNRVDAGYGDISTCIKAKRQFVGYKSDNPVTDELYDLAKLVIEDWATGTEEYRVLPHTFRYFYGDGRHNHFTTKPNGGGVEYNHLIPDPFV